MTISKILNAMKEGNNIESQRIAGYTWKELLGQYDNYLFDDYLPFIDKHVFDHEYGGFMCNTDRVGQNITTDKRTWYDGRGIWAYSFLYNNIKKDPEYLRIAQKTVELVLRAKQPESFFWPWSYNRTGADLSENTPDIYGNLFVAEGFAEYSIASEDSSFWDRAKEILLQCVEVYNQEDYLYKLEYSPIPTFTHAERVLGHWMIMLRLSTNLLRIKNDSKIEGVASQCIDALINYHYNPEFKLMNEVLNHDLTLGEGDISQFVYIGHAIESLWMIMDEALRRDDEELLILAAERFKFHVEVAWDDVYGGVFHGLDHVNENKWLTDKVLWAQQEVLVGLMILIEHSDDPWAYTWFDKMYNYVINTYPLKKYGYSLWNIGGDRKMNFKEKGIRIENFHHPRHLMLNKLKIEKIVSKLNLNKQI